MFVGTILRGINIDGYIANNLLEMESLSARHDELVAEMEARGYNHRSPLSEVPLPHFGKIDREASQAELLRRCPMCQERFSSLIDKESEL